MFSNATSVFQRLLCTSIFFHVNIEASRTIPSNGWRKEIIKEIPRLEFTPKIEKQKNKTQHQLTTHLQPYNVTHPTGSYKLPSLD